MAKKQKSKKYLILDTFFKALRRIGLKSVTIFRVIQISLFFSAFLTSPVFSEEQVGKSIHSSDVKKGVGTVITDSKRIREYGGEIVIDGSLRVFEPIMGKVFDLVEISTPVTPAANHARIFLRADGTKQALIILYDDGTTDTIATNQ